MFRFILSIIILSLPQIAMAQEAEASGLELLFGFLALILLSVGIPTLISLAIRFVTGSIIKTYIGAYVVILGSYLIAHQTIEGLPGGTTGMIALNLLPLSMFGSFLSQWIYYLRLPKKDA